MAPVTRDYQDALRLLNSLQSNRAIVSSISTSSRDMNVDAIPEMLEWTRRAGYDASDFGKLGLKCIHIAGTKGKGSVSAMVESILMQYRGSESTAIDGRRKFLGKIGMYTSPHLITVRERIRIDCSSISESLFAKYFFELWDRFEDSAPTSDPTKSKPSYFRYLTLMAFHAFLQEGVETAIIECGIGGTYDSTNILGDAVKCTAITKLEIDHVGMLGETIEEIASHKAGIIKKSVPIFSTKQISAARSVLESKAKQEHVHVQYVNRHPMLESGEAKVGLEGDFQKDNASLSISVAASYLCSLPLSFDPPSHNTLPIQFVRGLETTSLLGRCQVLHENNVDWLVDGAHTTASIEATAAWYASKLKEALFSSLPPTKTVLIFNQQDRDATTLLRVLVKGIREALPSIRVVSALHNAYVPTFFYATFCSNNPYRNRDGDASPDLESQQKIGRAFMTFFGSSTCVCFNSIEEAIELTRKVSEGEDRVLVLVTGSLHLAGGLLQVLQSQAKAIDDVP